MQSHESRGILSWRLRLVVAVGLLIMTMAMVGTASAQQGPGQYCVQDVTSSGVNCTANDVPLATLSPDISEVCLGPGDTVTVAFRARLDPNASSRYDVGLFIATDGGSALSGDSCYHDYLHPVESPPGNPFNPNGGPFRNLDQDACGDLEENDGVVFYDLAPIQVDCVDNTVPPDGVVDPISTCLSWDNNGNSACNDVSQAIPGTPAKCKCEALSPNPPILIYSGFDYGDLPDNVAGSPDYPTLVASNGPYHAVQDADNNGTPDTIGGIPAVWLGAIIDKETEGQPNSAATGDNIAGADDEEGVTPTYNSWTVGTGGNDGNASVTVVVSSSTNDCTGCKLAWWIDWNNNGDFDDTGESYSDTVGAGSNPLNFAVPSYVTNFNFSVYSRWRLYSPASVTTYPTPAYTNLVLNGEVEDYLWNLQPLGVTLANFSAMCTAGQPEISWETVSELNTLGFNVWRNTSNSGPQDKLNASLIPAHPGSSQGYTYTFVDTTAVANTTYYYWLEDIDTGNVSSFNGPIDIQCQVPTSVGMDTVEANPVAGAALPAAGLLAIGAAGAAAIWLRRRRA